MPTESSSSKTTTTLTKTKVRKKMDETSKKTRTQEQLFKHFQKQMMHPTRIPLLNIWYINYNVKHNILSHAKDQQTTTITTTKIEHMNTSNIHNIFKKKKPNPSNKVECGDEKVNSNS